ncbi:MAG: SBBP repeat-containing protein [Flavobacteriales bacterium]|nr:SBBP repeat-containing protein [Flavobacteriales bacterium]MCB9335681.1 SBBP repeat-containing protein [Flavobacteriales bacterium]
MKHIKLFLQSFMIIALFSSNDIIAQNQFIYEWAFRSAINGADEQINDAVYDSQENVYQTGIQNLTGGKVLIEKINVSGAVQWTKYFSGGAGSYNTGTSITLDTSNNVLVCGSFQNSMGVTGGPSLTSNGNDDIFLSKYDASGTHQWSFSLGGPSLDQAFSVATDQNNNVFITGYFIGTVDFDPSGNTANLTSAGAEDIFLAKYDANGNYLWAINAGSIDGSNFGYGVVTDPSGNVYISGQFFGTVDFDPSGFTNSLTSNGSADIFVAKYDSNGNYDWAFNIGSTGGDFAKNMSVDQNGAIYITGNFNGMVDFNPGTGTDELTTTLMHGFLAKYDFDGNYEWAINIGDQASSMTNAYGISNTVTDEIVISGSFLNSIDIDPDTGTETLTSNGSHDIFAAVYSNTGAFIKAVSFGSTGIDFGYATDQSSSGKIFIGGAFQNTVDFDPGTGMANMNAGTIGYDAFSAQYGLPPCSAPDLTTITATNLTICSGDSTTISVSSGNLNDADNWYWYSSSCGGTLIDTGSSIVVSPSDTTAYFVRGEGNCVTPGSCSTITINVNEPASGTDTQTACDSFIWIDGNTYTSTNNTATHTITAGAANGCDSIVTLNLTINISPVVTLDPFSSDTICDGSGSVSLPTGTPSGGIYSGTGINGTDFDPSLSGIGTFDIIYSYTDGNSCSNADTSTITVSICTGIENDLSRTNVIIAPNPFNNYLNITGLPEGKSVINILDVSGKLVVEFTVQSNNQTISTEQLTTGIYFIKVVSSNNIFTTKLIKQ